MGSPTMDQLERAAQIIADPVALHRGDGVVFSFRAGMNWPESENLSLVVEVRDQDGGPAEWHYEIGRDGVVVQEPTPLPPEES